MPTLTMTTCDSCLAPVAELPTEYGHTLCPRCSAREALETGAAHHLHTLLYPAVLAWVRHWSAAGVSASGLGTMLDLEGMYWHPEGAHFRGHDSAHESALQVISEALQDQQ